jgi:hypothetical protein
MTMPAPVCPATFREIKTLASELPDGEIARRLGWDVERLHRVARDRQLGVDFIRGPAWPSIERPAAAPVAPPAPPQPAASPRLANAKRIGNWQPDPPAVPIVGLGYDPEGGIVARDGVGIQLDPQLRPFFFALFTAHQRDPNMRVPVSHFDVSNGWASSRMREVGRALVPLRIGVQSKYGRGYRLVDLVEKEKEAEKS